ncbi:YkgJ family cysteine cluster protein [bacterium]|nr:YkgJ family cysteine cluster protein [bacterium]
MMAQHDQPAGEFSTWLQETRKAQLEENGTDVPCGECNACCRSSYFIHISPEEIQTLARIPKELLFPAPGLPPGNVLMGYDENGRCPMLSDNGCLIYEHRPLTCRTYDCRIFPATGMTAGDKDKVLINQQIQRWKFRSDTTDALNRHSAVKAAALFLREHAENFPAGFIPGNATQLAILAINVYDVFLKEIETSGKNGRPTPDIEIVNAIVAADAAFERECRAKRPK